mgnify:CR=1 FL=1
MSRKLAANSSAVCQNAGHPSSNEGCRIGRFWSDSDTRGCKCSGIAQNKGIQNIRVTAIALMEHFETADDLANTDLDKLTAFISETG